MISPVGVKVPTLNNNLVPASHPANTGMRGYDLPFVVKFLEVHGAVAHYRLLGAWESDRPPSQGKCKIGLQQPDLDAFGLNETHSRTTRIAANVGIVKLLPPVKLLRADDNQQFWRIPVNSQVSFNVVGIPPVEHFEQDLIDLLVIGLGNA